MAVPFTQSGPLIGDVINRVRLQIPDPAPTLTTPASTVSVVAAVGSTLPAGNYYAVVTQLNPWGEALPTAESAVLTVGANQGIQVTSTLLPGCIAVRCYLTSANGAAGTEQQYVQSSTSPFTISTPPVNAGIPPTQSTAYLPDSDGNSFSAAALYGWLNDGLNKMSRNVGGILDYCGVPTSAGQPLYVCPGQWLQITDVWFSGYWVQGGRRLEFYRRNTVQTQILQAVTVSIMSDKQVIEVSYQPNRNAGVTTLTADLSATSTSSAIASSSVFLLPFGFAQIGTEIVAYSTLGTGTMTGLIRGIGNSFAQAWPAGTTVTELSLFWCGKRLFTTKFSPGNASQVLPVPSGWEEILPLYIRSMVKAAEQDDQASASLMQQFDTACEKWFNAANKPPSFVQVGGNRKVVTVDNTVAGGLIVPI